MQKKTNNDRKRLGAYYTPREVADILSNWAIRSKHDRVLEPGFGGCGFLEASTCKLKALGSSRPLGQLYGCDIDPDAFASLRDKLGVARPNRRFLRSDFLRLRPEDFSIGGFDVVLGNPPYVSRHTMSIEQAREAALTVKEVLPTLPKTSSLWAYFAVHSTAFLRQGGRMAWVLPISFLHADYARPIQQYLVSHFSRVTAIKLGQRLFDLDGVSEQSVILVANDWKNGSLHNPAPLETAFASNTKDLARILEIVSYSSWNGTPLSSSYPYTHLSDQAKRCFDVLLSSETVMDLGDLAEIRIGIVTGANRFFVLDQATVEREGLLQDALTNIVPSLTKLGGLAVSRNDLAELASAGERCILVDTLRVERVSGRLKHYLARFPISARKENITFQKRDRWHEANDGAPPHAFLSYMSHKCPRLVLNTARTTSLNSVHRVYFFDHTQQDLQQLLAISLVSTFSQVSAEICGRTYGDGVLKLEPSEARMIKLLCPIDKDQREIANAFHRVDRLLRNLDYDGARKLADNFLLGQMYESDRNGLLRCLSDDLDMLRSRRILFGNG